MVAAMAAAVPSEFPVSDIKDINKGVGVIADNTDNIKVLDVDIDIWNCMFAVLAFGVGVFAAVYDWKGYKASKMTADNVVRVSEEVQVAFATHEEVDSLNVLNATKKAMLQCVNSLTKADKVLIDAVTLSAKIPTLGIIHGDALSYSIAAASIVAKVTRDRLMKQYDRQYPLYNFAKHKGYGTAEHIRLLGQYGACPIHRKTFIKKFVTEEQ